ncbi:MAG: cupin domain-containing protein [Burkholderiales bacterium]|nr:cupin domain-containing protein [Burkholderiales bacterium]
MPENVRPVRRIVVRDEGEKSHILVDAPSPDVRTDPARPGYASTRIWVTDRTPARMKDVRDTLDAPHTLEPPAGGSVCRVITIPPDSSWTGRVGEKEVRSHFATMGSPSASSLGPSARHPYMQRTRTLDFCLILDGEVTLVLDMQEVALKAGDTVVQRGTNHAWSNRSNRPCTIAISSHDARS